MRYVICLLVVTLLALAGPQAGLAQGDKRVALVIGNSAYQHAGALPNPKNDAEAIARLLREKGFAVTLESNLNYRAIREAVRVFGQAVRDADVALIYYAGHGLEVAGENYLVPTDAKLEREADLEYEAVTLASVLNAVARARRLRLVVLDACRNNPLGEKMRLGSGTTRSVARGLARIEPGRNVLVAYAAKEGTVAQDGTGGHSPYAEALLKHMATPGLDVQLMFRKVRDHVLAATSNEQEPFTYGSLGSDVVPLVPGMPLTKEQDVELAFWTSVKDSTTPVVLRTYLERYPDGEFAPIARALIEHYERQIRAEVAAREEAKRRRDEERRAADAKRIEEERKAGEAALAEERKRAEDAKNGAEAKAVEEKQRAEWLTRTEELKKALEEVRLAREAAAAAEKERLAAVKAAEEAKKVAEQAIAKREAEKTGNPTKLAALPKIEAPQGGSQFDGALWVNWKQVSGCRGKRESGSYPVVAIDGKLSGVKGRLSGTVSDTGAARWTVPSRVDDVPFNCSATIRGDGGSGSCKRTSGHCDLSITIKLGALPTIPQGAGTVAFDGRWQIEFVRNAHCNDAGARVVNWTINQGALVGTVRNGFASGIVSSAGDLRASFPSPASASVTVAMVAKLQGSKGAGTFQVEGHSCAGAVKLSRM